MTVVLGIGLSPSIGRRVARYAAAAAVGAWLVVLTYWACQFYLVSDAMNYLAAGERLNAGHQLYALMPGDRPVFLDPPYWSVPLLSPPLVAVVFRPLAALPLTIGVWLWWAATVAALLAAVWMTFRAGWVGLGALAVLGPSFAILLASGNLNSLLVLAAFAVWIARARPRVVGPLVAAMILAKLLPLSFAAFLVARRDWRGLRWFAVALAAIGTLELVGAGWPAHVSYITVLSSSAPQAFSLSYLTGWRPLSFLVFAVGCVFVAFTRSDARSFRLAVLTALVGSPAVGVASLTLLLALVAPTTQTVVRRSAVGTDAAEPGGLAPLGRLGHGLVATFAIPSALTAPDRRGTVRQGSRRP